MSMNHGWDQEVLREGLDACGADAWLLYDFRGVNPVASRVLNVGGMGSRRLFVLLPRDGEPAAIVHRIEQRSLRDFPGRVQVYSAWKELRDALAAMVSGRTLAMEISPRDAVPYLDRVPFGVVELIESLGGKVVSSSPLVTWFAARWTEGERQAHRKAAEFIAQLARSTLRDVVGAGEGVRETEIQARLVTAIRGAGLNLDHPPIVAFGANAADPHYEPRAGHDAVLARDQVVLIDLWAADPANPVWADQTWMGFSGPTPPERVARVWQVVRDAREAAIGFVMQALEAGRDLRGFEVDRVTRQVIQAAGFGDAFVHRTGHSIDRDLHGSGPHCDDYETHDDRLLVEGVGFSIEPGVYLPGEFGIRSEVNMYWGPEGGVVTPSERQESLILPG